MPKLHPNQGDITIESQITVIENTKTIIMTVLVAGLCYYSILKV